MGSDGWSGVVVNILGSAPISTGLFFFKEDSSYLLNSKYLINF